MRTGQMPLDYKKNLREPLKLDFIDTAFQQGDKNAQIIRIEVMDGEGKADLTGMTVTGQFERGDGSRVPYESATINNNVVNVTIPEACYNVSGAFVAFVRLTSENGYVRRTILRIAGRIEPQSDGPLVDPGHTLPTMDELLAKLEAMERATEATNQAIASANTAAQAASEAATSIDNMTVVADTLEPGQEATVAKGRNGERGMQLRFGLPKGDRGSTVYNGTAITGTSVTPTAYATGIENALVGDLYANTGTDDADAGNIYECTKGGNEASALWVYKTNWRGVPGAGNVSSVDGVQPGGNGNVALHAVRTVSQSLSLSEKTRARANIGLDDPSIATIVTNTVGADIYALKNKFQSGALTVAVTEDGKVATQRVDFPTAFESVPAVMVVINSNASLVLNGGNCSASGVDAQGFTVNAFRTTAGNLPVRWLAFVPTTGGSSGGSGTTVQPGSDAYTQIMALLNEMSDDITANEDAISELFAKVEELENDAGTGEGGQDGFSPVAAVTQTSTGAKISITDKNGTTTAEIANGKDGKDGQDGYTPVKGVDYFDGVDGKNGSDGKDGYTPVKGKDYFDGEPGSNGENGKDGVSATHSWNGTTLTVTSASGTSSANLKGEKGDTGETGQQGPAGSDGAKGDKGDKGDPGSPGSDGKDGTSVTVKSVSESSADGGSNVVTFSDGKTLTVKNGSKGSTGSAGKDGTNGSNGADGVGIKSVVQTTTSSADGGSNVVTVTKTDNTTSTFTIKNGSKGSTGAAGKTPVKGTDYFTADDKAEIVSAVVAALPVYAGEVV